MSLKVLLIKRDGCPHCDSFKPVFQDFKKDLTKNLSKLKNKFKLDNVEAEIFDSSNSNDELKYFNYGLIQVNGVPSIFLNYYDKNGKQRILKEVKDRGSNVSEFTNNVISKFTEEFNNLEADNNNKQNGGNFILNDDLYLDKYLKYKNKYIALKRSL